MILNLKNIHIVETKHYYIKDLLLKSNLKKQFDFLSSKTLFKDFILSNLSDINIYDYKIWIKHGFEDLNKAEYFGSKSYFKQFDKIKYPKIEDSEKWIEEDLKEFGYDIGSYIIDKKKKNEAIQEFKTSCDNKNLSKYGGLQKLYKTLKINNYNRINEKFIPNIGQIHFSKKAFFSNAFESYSLKGIPDKGNTGSIIFEKNELFGLAKNQSNSYLPLTIGKKQKLKTRIGNFKSNTIIIKNKKISIMPKLKINVFPNGLLSIYISYSIVAHKGIKVSDTIDLINNLLHTKNNNILLTYKTRNFTSHNSLYEYILNNIISTLFLNPKNTEVVDFKKTTVTNIIPKSFTEDKDNETMQHQLIGLLNLDKNYVQYSSDFRENKKSIFGKYNNDYIISNSNSLLFIFDDNFRHRSLPFWDIVKTFNFYYFHKTINSHFTKSINEIIANDNVSKETLMFFEKLKKLILTFGYLKNLPPSLRKLYYEIYKSSGYSHNDIENLINKIDYFNNHYKMTLNDTLIMQPNFMGFGIDLSKLFKIFKT